MYIFHFLMINLDLWNAFCEVSPWGSFLFALQMQKKSMHPWGWGYHENTYETILWYTTYFFVISPKQRIWSWNFGFATTKIWPCIWFQKMYFFRLSTGDENVIDIRSFNYHPEYFGVHFSWWNHQRHFKIRPQRTQNLEFINLNCVTNKQPIHLSLRWLYC